MSRDVAQLSLFSKNERFTEVASSRLDYLQLPTSSLPFLLAPAYLGVAHQNKIVEPAEKIDELKLAKVRGNEKEAVAGLLPRFPQSSFRVRGHHFQLAVGERFEELCEKRI